jgi:hypothetical protein
MALLAFLGAASCSKESSASSGGSTLTLTKPSNQSMTQGTSNRVAISIDRKGFADPVKIAFSNLPNGVTVAEDMMPSGEDHMDFTLVASPTAAVVEKQPVTVTATGRGGAQVKQTFELTVKAK